MIQWQRLKKLNNLKLLYFLFFSINIGVALFILIVVSHATSIIFWEGGARGFLEDYNGVPIPPDTAAVRISGLFLLLIASHIAKLKIKKKNYMYLLCLIDIVIGTGITYYLNLSYTGIFFLIIASISIHMEKSFLKFLYSSVCALLYIILDNNFFPISGYIRYFSPDQRNLILLIKNILFSLNQVVFISFIALIIHKKIEENKNILSRNKSLFEISKKLKAANVQLKEYAEKTEELIKIKERNRLARELHDTIGHYLTAIITGLEACIELIDRNPKDTKVQIEKISGLSRDVLLDVRRSVNDLKPDTLEQMALGPAIEHLIAKIRPYSNVDFHLSLHLAERDFQLEQRNAIYRVVQEGTTNSIKHSMAKNLWVELFVEKSNLVLNIRDDGNGCDQIKEGFGLKNMRERIEALEGRIEYHSESGRGFFVRCIIDITM